MAINTQKFLPLAKSSSAIVKSAGSNISTEKNKGGAIIKQKKLDIKKFIPPEKQKEEKEETYGAIVKSLVSIDKFLKSGLLGDKKTFEAEKQEKKEEKSKEREKKLETKEKPKGLPGGISLPKFDFLESVKRYFLFTFLGWLFTNTQQYLPQLLKIVDIIKPVISVAEFIFKGLLEGFIGFIDLGYKAYDTVRGVVKNLGGEGAQKTFDDLSKNLNTLITTTILVAGAIAALGGKSKGAPGAPSPRGGTPGPRVPRSLTGRPIPTTSGGRPLGRPDVRNPLRERSRVTGTGGGRAGGLDIRNPLRQGPRVTTTGGARAAGRFSGKGGIKLASKIGSKALKAVPFLGTGIAIVEGIMRIRGGDYIGGLLSFGTAIPVAGWAFLALDVAREFMGGTEFDKKVGRSLSGKPSRPNKRVTKAAAGGITRGGKKQKAVRRTIKVAPRKPIKLPPQKSQPGRDVGGEKEIRKLYPDPDKMLTLDEFIRSPMGQGSYNYLMYKNDFKKRTKKPNPYKALTSTSKILKEIPFVGGLMGAAVDIALGQKPDKNVYKSLSSAIGYLVENLANKKATENISSLARDIRGFADGGYVPASRQLKDTYKSSNTGDMIAKLLGPTIDQRVNEAIQSVDKELQKRKKKEEEEDGGGPDGGGGPGGGGGGGMLPGDAPPEMKAALEAIAGAEGGWNSVNPGKVVPGLTNMTIAQAREVGMRQRKIEGSGALGKFQQIPVYEGVNTLKQRAEAAGLDYQKDKFNEENQTKIARAYIAGIYPGGEAQLVKDAKKDPMILADKLKGVYPSLPGGDQPNVHTSGYLDRYNQSLEKHRTIKLGAITPDKIYPLDPSQGRDPGQPGIDFTYKGGKTLALYPGKVVDIESQYNSDGSGYGNYVLVESIDPNNGKKFTALYAHFGDGKIYVRKGDTIQSGQVIGAQPNRNIRGHFTGSGSGEHTSVDFYQLDGRTKYGGSDKLITQILDSFAGKNPYPTQTQPPKSAAKPAAKPQASNPNIINASGLALGNLHERISKLKSGQKIVFDNVGSIQSGKNWLGQPEVKFFNTKGENIKEDKFYELLRDSEVLKQMKSNNSKVRNMQGGGIVSPSKPRIPNIGKSAYYDEQGSTVVFVPIETQVMVPVPTNSSGGSLMFPSSSLNIKDTYPIHSLSRG